MLCPDQHCGEAPRAREVWHVPLVQGHDGDPLGPQLDGGVIEELPPSAVDEDGRQVAQISCVGRKRFLDGLPEHGRELRLGPFA